MVVLVQATVVPRLRWTPANLIRLSAILMTGGIIVATFSPDEVVLGVGVALLGTGLGFAMPGMMSAPTLAAKPEEQGAVAGLVSSATALAFMLGPLLGNRLYEVSPIVPYLVGTGLLVVLTVFVFVYPGLRHEPRSENLDAAHKGDTDRLAAPNNTRVTETDRTAVA